MSVEQAIQVAVEHHRTGRLAEAEGMYRQILAAQPRHADALHLLGVLAAQTRRTEMAVELIRSAIAVTPAAADFHNNLGNALRELGKIPEAMAAYRQSLLLKPQDNESAQRNLHSLLSAHGQTAASSASPAAPAPPASPRHYDRGIALARAGQLAPAAEAFAQSLCQRPDDAMAYYHLGTSLAGLGRREPAIAALRHAISLKPDYAHAWNWLGNLLVDQRQFDEAIDAYRTAIRLAPDYAGSHYNLGIALWEKGKLEEAQAAYREAIRVKPDFSNAYNNLGNVLKRTGDNRGAIEAYRKALALDPSYADAINNLGVALLEEKSPDEAIAWHRQAVKLAPQRASFFYNLGVALEAAGKSEEAIEQYHAALRLDPAYAEAHYNLGHALGDKGQLDAAIDAYRRAVALKPQWAEPRYNLGLSLLLKGDYAGGWAEYEWRWGAKDFPSPLRDRGRPKWEGQPLTGKSILLHAEQGLGDTVQFIRYAPLVAARGARVVVECAPDLERLVRGVEGVEQVVTTWPPPPTDFHCPLLSLPLVFETRLDSIPASVPYITIDPALIEQWGQRIRADIKKMRIGLAWAGQPGHRNDRNRSVSLADLGALAQSVEVVFYSLQKGPASAQAAHPPTGMELIDLTSHVSDLADTAALMSHLDLIITVDTAVAHLAGALGKPVWVMLPHNPDWRWMREGERSAWYPTMRLFRQGFAGDKSDVIDRIAAAMAREYPAHASGKQDG